VAKLWHAATTQNPSRRLVFGGRLYLMQRVMCTSMLGAYVGILFRIRVSMWYSPTKLQAIGWLARAGYHLTDSACWGTARHVVSAHPCAKLRARSAGRKSISHYAWLIAIWRRSNSTQVCQLSRLHSMNGWQPSMRRSLSVPL
jgi:hypothetical protein